MKTSISEPILGMTFKYFTNDNMAGSSISCKKEWETHITKFTKLYNELYHIKNIIDVGANFGYHTLLFSRECSENVYAFEPQIQIFELLKENVENNDIRNVFISNYACGDTSCDVNIQLFNDNDCKTNLNMGNISPNINCTNNFTTTKCILLDGITSDIKIDLIKIDVQGWEKKVLMGAINLLKTHKPVLIVCFEKYHLQKTDTTCEELFSFIRKENYYIYYLDYMYPCHHVCVHNDNIKDFRIKFNNNIFPHIQNNPLNDNFINRVYEKIVL